MVFLLVVSLLWAFSFGLIKDGLTEVAPAAVAFARLAIALVVFVPFLRLKKLKLSDTIRLLITGAVQYGLMYVTYIRAFQYLHAYEVALFTVLTPIYVIIINDLSSRRFRPVALAAVILAVAGGAVIEYQQIDSRSLWAGFALMQVANLSFAFGQVFYRRTMERMSEKPKDVQVFAVLYLGATVTAALAAIGSGWGYSELTLGQGAILLYLGAIASGLGFFLWNVGARRTSAGTLAVFNNLKIPLAVVVSVLFFGESAHWLRLLIGCVLMIAALLILPKTRVSE